MNRKTILYLLILLLFFISCHNKDIDGIVYAPTKTKTKKDDTPLIESNKKWIALENENIDLFIKRYGWNPVTTASGLRIEVIRQGRGSRLQAGETVTLAYKMKLLSGERLYDSQQDGVKTIKIDKSEEIIGLHEALKLLNRDSKARLVIPSYLAYGIAGDGDQIIGRKAVVMIIEVQQVLDDKYMSNRN